MTWVRFHGELRAGEKRGLPRATRFVYLELSHEARPLGGYIVLPVGMPDVEAVCDVLGGNRREVVEALKLLTSGEKPMVSFENFDGKRVLVVIEWLKWNPVGDSSTNRVREWRKEQERLKEQRRKQECNALPTVANESPKQDEDVTRAPVSARGRNSLSLSLSDSFSSSEQDPRVTSMSTGRRKRRTRCPESAASDVEVREWALQWAIPSEHPRFARFVDWHRSTDTLRADWTAAWRTWLDRPEFDRPSGVRHAVQPIPDGGRVWKVGTDGE